MNPFVAVGSVAIFLLVGSAVMSFVQWLTAVIGRAASWAIVLAGAVVAGAGTWFVNSRGGPQEMLVLGAIVGGGVLLGVFARTRLGTRAVAVVAAGMVAEVTAVAAWLLWYNEVLHYQETFRPWARAVAAGLSVGVAVFVVVLGLAALGQVIATAKWAHQALLGERPQP
jgi:hypothetical protein